VIAVVCVDELVNGRLICVGRPIRSYAYVVQYSGDGHADSVTLENVPALLATLKAAGVTVDTDGGEALSVGGWLRAFIRDPNGLLIELVEDRDRR